MSEALPLPPRPNLEQYKSLARDLQNACKSSEPGAIRKWAVCWLDALARLRSAGVQLDAGERESKAEQIEQHWNRLKESNEHVAKCALTAAQFFIARAHGFANWPKFANHIQELSRANSHVSAFEAAADAIVSGDASTLQQLLHRDPGLVRERSTREHRSTLLHYVSANGIEDFRQKTPRNIVEIASLLLDAGADVDAESDAYGGGCTTLGLVATSAHPERAGVQIALLQTLLDRGANLHHRSSAGNKHGVVHGCIANGQPAAAKFLADLGAPMDLESAAAVDCIEVLREYFDESGARRPETNPKQIESAFLYACGYGSLNAAKFLLDRGVDPAACDDQGQTALHWAVCGPQTGAIQLLLERGAPVDLRDKRFHATPLDTALWTWNNAPKKEDRERCYEAVALLARAGAKLDRDQWRNPGEVDSAMLQRIDADPRMQAALRGESS